MIVPWRPESQAERGSRLDEAVELTRTGDLWLFRGDSVADHAIRTLTNAPVNHVGMAVVARRPAAADVARRARQGAAWTSGPASTTAAYSSTTWTAAVTQWMDRYEQRGWLRQLSVDVTPAMEDALLTTIARMDGLPFPSTVGLLGRVARGRLHRRAPAELAYCAEVVAEAYIAMGLLDGSRPSNYYDPGKFWSGDDLDLELGATLGEEIAVYRTERPQPW